MKYFRYAFLLAVVFTGLSNTFYAQTFWKKFNVPNDGLNIAALAVSGQDSNEIVLAGMGHSGLYLSGDKGTTWTQGNFDVANPDIHSLAVSPQGYFYAGSFNAGLFRSIDSGKTWKQIGSIGPDGIDAVGISKNGHIFAFILGKIYRSTDNGEHWSVFNTGNMISVSSFASDDSSRVYIGTSNGIFYSIDDGLSWTRLGLSGEAVATVAVGKGGLLMAGTMSNTMLKSTDNGKTWTTSKWGPDFYSLVMNSEGEAFAGTAGEGVAQFSKSGDFVKYLTDGMGQLVIYTLAVNQSGKLIAGSFDKGVFISQPTLTDIKVNSSRQPLNYQLLQNYPNPFNPKTQIQFSLTEGGLVTLRVYNILGQMVKELVNGELKSGVHKMEFDGNSLASGIYIYKLDVKDKYSDVKKMTLLK